MVLLLLTVFYVGYSVVEFILNLTIFFHFNVVKVLIFVEVFILVCKSSTENRIYVTAFAAHY